MTVLAQRARMVTSTEVLVAALVLCAFAGAWMRNGVAGNARLATAGTVFCGVFLQAVPFLVLGVLVSGLVETSCLATGSLAGYPDAPPAQCSPREWPARLCPAVSAHRFP
jgi:hypothetical protein